MGLQVIVLLLVQATLIIAIAQLVVQLLLLVNLLLLGGIGMELTTTSG